MIEIGRADDHETARIEAELGKPAHRQRAGLALGKVLPDPDQRLPCGDARGQAAHEAGRGRCLAAAFREHLVQRAGGEPALQHRVRLVMAERDPAQIMRAIGRLETGNAAAQTRERIHACAGHPSPLLSSIVRVLPFSL